MSFSKAICHILSAETKRVTRVTIFFHLPRPCYLLSPSLGVYCFLENINNTVELVLIANLFIDEKVELHSM